MAIFGSQERSLPSLDFSDMRFPHAKLAFKEDEALEIKCIIERPGEKVDG